MSARLTLDQELIASVSAMVRRRVPAADVDDVVQSALTDVVACAEPPESDVALRRWVAGVVKHKVADFYRRRHREVDLDQAPEPIAMGPAPEDRDLLRWARRQLPTGDAARTLDWMMQEAEGDKLEAIAEREALPAARVRQRVHRLRAFFRERFARELALASLTVVVLLVVATLWLTRRDAPPIAHDPPSPRDGRPAAAESLRRSAEAACLARDFARCKTALDEARALEPAGEETPRVRELRDQIDRFETPAPLPSDSVAPPSPTPRGPRAVPVPTVTAAPMPAPSSAPSARPGKKFSKPPPPPTSG